MANKFELDEKVVRKLAEILKETGLSEIEYQVDAQRIRVARQAAAPLLAAPTLAVAEAPASSAAPPAAAAVAGKPGGAVTSPMVGTVYLSPEPGKPAFVKVGDRVKQGQTLLIIEAMKVMNALPAPKAGTVTQVLVADGQPVEFGEALVTIE